MGDRDNNQPNELDSAVAVWAERGLANYLEDVDMAAEVVGWLHQETNIPKAALRVAIKLLAPVVCGAARKGGTWLGDMAKERVAKALACLPLYDQFVAAVHKLSGRLDQELAAKQAIKEILAGRRPPHDMEFASNLTLDLQAEIAALKKLDELSRQVAKGFAEIKEFMNPQPALRLRMLSPDDGNRFFYGAQKVPFVGRDDELGALADFLYTDDSFKWWLVAGAGGLGKSRLALEFCLRHGMAWRAGFLPPNGSLSNLNSWQPSQPTLLIADYAGSRASELKELVLTLHERRQDLLFPVRLLLLERETEGTWWPAFQGTGGDRHTVKAARYDEALEVSKLGDEALWKIIEFLVRESGRSPPARKRALADLKTLDEQARPLFAAFLADALAAGRDPRAWDREALIGDILDREAEKHWLPAGVTEEDQNLLALATMTGGFDLAELSTVDENPLLPTIGNFSPQRYRALCGRSAEQALSPLEPDILGELFVLERLKPEHVADTARADSLRKNAWKLGSVGMGKFLSRAGMDFPTHATLRLLDEPAADNPVQRMLWSMASVNLIAHYGDAGDIPAARGLYDDLAAFASAHPDEPEVHLRRAQGALNLIYGYSNAGDIVAAHGLYDDLAALAAAHPDDTEVREPQAKGAFNLIIGYRNAGDIASAHGLYDDLAALAAAHPDDTEVREAQVKGAFNLIIGYSNAGDIASARALYDNLAALAAEHPDEPVVHLRQAQAAVNLIDGYGEADDTAAAHGLYDDLAALAAAHPDDTEVREAQAKGAFNLIIDYGNAGDIASARALYDNLAALAADHPDEPVVHLRRARGAANLIAYYVKAGVLLAASSLYVDLATLATAHPDDPEVREAQAWGASHLIIDYGNADDLPAARALYDELATLAAAHPDEAEVREPQAKALVTLISRYGKSGETATAEKLLEAVKDVPELADKVESIRGTLKSTSDS